MARENTPSAATPGEGHGVSAGSEQWARTSTPPPPLPAGVGPGPASGGPLPTRTRSRPQANVLNVVPLFPFPRGRQAPWGRGTVRMEHQACDVVDPARLGLNHEGTKACAALHSVTATHRRRLFR